METKVCDKQMIEINGTFRNLHIIFELCSICVITRNLMTTYSGY